MKTAVFLLLFSLGFMAYRGDFGDSLKNDLAILEVKKITSILQTAEPVQPSKPKELRDVIREDSRAVRLSEIVVNDPAVKPLPVDVFKKEKSSAVAQIAWLEGVAPQEDRTVLEKLRNLVAWGKFE